MTGHPISTSSTPASTDTQIDFDTHVDANIDIESTVDTASDAPAASPQPPTPLLEYLDLGIDTDTSGGGICDANGVCS